MNKRWGSSTVEHLLGKEKVVGSNPISSLVASDDLQQVGIQKLDDKLEIRKI